MFFSTLRAVEEYPIGAEVESLELSGFNGSITWEPLDGGPARVLAEKEVRGFGEDSLRAFLAELRIEEQSSAHQLVLRAVSPQRPFGVFASQVRFVVFAPGEQIKHLRAKTSNGGIRLRARTQGILHLTTKNGSITLAEAEGQVSLRTSNGRIEFGKLVLTGSSSLLTSNGRIEGQLELSGEGDHRIATSNGHISLRMPHGSQGSIRAATSNGKVEVLVGDTRATGRREVVIHGGEGPHLEITTSNGSISVLGY